MNNTCASPPLPNNSFTVSEDWRKNGDGVVIRCALGFGFNGDPDTLEDKIHCVESSNVSSLVWDLDPSGWLCERKQITFIMVIGVFNLCFLGLSCPDPQTIDSATMTTARPTSGFKFGDKILYECDTGTTADGKPRLFTHESRCNESQQWYPDPNTFQCLGTIR